MIKDYLGQEVSVNDEVAYQTTGKGRGFARGLVVKETPKGVTLWGGRRPINPKYPRWSYTNRPGEWFIKVPEGLRTIWPIDYLEATR